MDTTISRPQPIPLALPEIAEQDIDAVVDVLRSSTLSIGPQLDAFEDALARYAGARYGIGVNSGTSGLHLCVIASEIGPGDEVITSPFSFVASANCIAYTGATPVFADIDEDTLALDPARVADVIGPQTRALIPVDVFGEPSPVEAYRELATNAGLTVIRDACEALGAERDGIAVGDPSTCDMAVLAFYPNKQLTTGEGGMIVTDDARRATVMRSLRNQGRDDAGTWMNHVRLGYNYRLDEMSAALGLSQLGRLDTTIARRGDVAAWYATRLSAIDGVRLPTVSPRTSRMSWFVYVIRLDEDVDRADLMQRLSGDGIPTRPYFVPIHLQPYYRERYGYAEGDFPVTERVAASTLALPFFTSMDESQVDYVCDRLAHHLPLARHAGSGTPYAAD
jgi:perosamine synthetase